MILKFLLFLLPFTLFAGELVWSGKGIGLSESDQKKALREYVLMKYPEKVKAWDEQVLREKEIANNTVTIDGLMWQDNKAVEITQRDWKGAKEYCSSLELLGFNDWRLPNKSELESIVDKGRRPAIKRRFKHIASNLYWSSSSNVSDSSYAFSVGFAHGDLYGYDKTFNAYVRCSRAEQ